jgi:hypothetical protein
VIPQAPAAFWSWDRIPTSFHGAVKDREFHDTEVARLAKYQMATIEKWYTPCGSAGPTQSGPSCGVEGKIEGLFKRIRVLNPNQTAILYWNSMFDFQFYTAHQRMLDLEAAGTAAFLRDETGEVISLCNDGNVYVRVRVRVRASASVRHLLTAAPRRYCNITTFDWTQPKVRELWVGTVVNATATGLIDGIFADHSSNEGTRIGNTKVNGQARNQLCNGKGSNRHCYNFTAAFRDEFNSWHGWATNYTQALLSNTTGGPVIQGPLASMNTLDSIVDPQLCDFDSILAAQASPMGRAGAVFEVPAGVPGPVRVRVRVSVRVRVRVTCLRRVPLATRRIIPVPGSPARRTPRGGITGGAVRGVRARALSVLSKPRLSPRPSNALRVATTATSSPPGARVVPAD